MCLLYYYFAFFPSIICQHMALPNTCFASDQWFNQAETNYKTAHIFERLRSLSNDGDGREPDGNKATALDWQNITLFCTFLCRRCTTTTWNCRSNFTFCRGREDKTALNFLFFFPELWYSPLEFNSKKKLPTFDELNEMEWARLSLRHCEFTF